MKRQLGSLSAGDLGAHVKAQPVKPESGLPKHTQPIAGTLESVHHFRVADEDFSSCIVRIVRTAKQVKAKEPDCREVRGPSAREIEVGT